MIKRYFMAFLLAAAFAPAVIAQSSSPGNAARIVAWQPKEGMTREFDLGYRRHLDWHRAQNDSWSWHGWSIVTGPRTGYFVDGTFFHHWTDFDSPVAPREDAADNALNVSPYATLRSVGAFEAVDVARFDATQLTAPLLTFTYIEVAPGRAAQFESLVASRGSAGRAETTSFALLRPVAGAHEYLLLLPARLQSDLVAHARFTEDLLARIAKGQAGAPIVVRVRTETGRYREDLSYMP